MQTETPTRRPGRPRSGPTKLISVRLPETVVAALEEESERDGMSIASLVRRAILRDQRLMRRGVGNVDVNTNKLSSKEGEDDAGQAPERP